MTDTRNVDPQEIAKFEAWPLAGGTATASSARCTRSTPAGQLYRRALSRGRTCGWWMSAVAAASWPEAMAQRGPRSRASTWASAAGVARLHQQESGLAVDYRQSTAEELAAREAGSFDIVCCLEMLEHVPDRAR